MEVMYTMHFEKAVLWKTFNGKIKYKTKQTHGRTNVPCPNFSSLSFLKEEYLLLVST